MGRRKGKGDPVRWLILAGLAWAAIISADIAWRVAHSTLIIVAVIAGLSYAAGRWPHVIRQAVTGRGRVAARAPGRPVAAYRPPVRVRAAGKPGGVSETPAGNCSGTAPAGGDISGHDDVIQAVSGGLANLGWPRSAARQAARDAHARVLASGGPAAIPDVLRAALMAAGENSPRYRKVS